MGPGVPRIYAPRKRSAERQPITPYVVIIRLDWSLPDLENFDWEDEGLDPEEDDPLDEGYPPVEGCKLKDVG